MSAPHKCPVCYGYGKIVPPQETPGWQRDADVVTCPECAGAGKLRSVASTKAPPAALVRGL